MFGQNASHGSLVLLCLQPSIQHLHRHIDIIRLASDSHQALFGVDGLAGRGGCTRVGDADLALRLLADLVDLLAALADDWRSALRICVI